ncbi:MAG: hypothetical protein KJ955_01260 [Nanoarchaeota archaeon]|nr:hypothetical protein [Nanoarchaeota archaeon]
MKQKQKFEIPWWDEWYNADMLKRLELVKKLLITKELANAFVKMGIKKKYAETTAASTVNGYFEDFKNYMAEREWLKDKKKR